jgi:hypothetical protein
MDKARFDLKRRLGMYNLKHGGKRKRQAPGIGRITHISTLAEGSLFLHSQSGAERTQQATWEPDCFISAKATNYQE